MQSNHIGKLHLGIIMDGNGRWATARGMPRSRGHRAGVDAIRPIAEAAAEAGVGTLTLYAFSSDNWRRPEPEVSALMGLLRLYLDEKIDALVKAGIRLNLIGRRDRFPVDIAARIANAECQTAAGTKLHLRIAFDYSSRDAILDAAMKADPGMSRQDFSRLIARDGAPDVDLLIRTGGEQRLSDFLLWESAYAELLFVESMWPDYGTADLRAAIAQFHGRQRRFGDVVPSVAAA